jgi:hypothetical protein
MTLLSTIPWGKRGWMQRARNFTEKAAWTAPHAMIWQQNVHSAISGQPEAWPRPGPTGCMAITRAIRPMQPTRQSVTNAIVWIVPTGIRRWIAMTAMRLSPTIRWANRGWIPKMRSFTGKATWTAPRAITYRPTVPNAISDRPGARYRRIRIGITGLTMPIRVFLFIRIPAINAMM